MKVFNRVVLVIAFVSLHSVSRGDDTNYQATMAKAVRAAAEHVLPSIVMIEIIGTSEGGQGEVEQDAPTSGLVIGSDEGVAYVITSSIVAAKPAASILVVLRDGTRQTASVVAKDEHRDLVLLKMKADVPVATIQTDSEMKLQIGQTVIAVGRYGGEATPMVSTGILSATGRLDGIALQTDARVSASLYGGSLVDLYGNVLGILIPAVAEGGAENPTDWYDSGVAFAIPTDVIAKKIDRLKSGQDIKKGLLGIVSKSQDPNDEGTEIAAVRTRSPAESAGIKAGDRVLSIAGTPIKRHQELRQVLGSYDAGEEVPLSIDRDGETIELVVTLADSIPPLQPQRLGMIAIDRENEVIVGDVVPRSSADGKLQTGDVIAKIGKVEIDSSETLRRQMISAEPKSELSITVMRENKETTVKLVPESIAGKSLREAPKSWEQSDAKAWVSEEIKLPDAANAAFYIAPKPDDQQRTDLGLLILLLGPGEATPKSVIDDWKTSAQQSGVVVCAVAPENSAKWQPKEIEVIANFAAAMMKKADINSAAVAVASLGAISGVEATAADSMALAVSISQSKTFFGVAVSAKTQPPAVRLRENEATASLQLMMPIETTEELPPWGAAIQSAGYPIVLGGKLDQLALLHWVRLLQAI